MKKMNKLDMEDLVSTTLEDKSLEELLELFDLTPLDVIWDAYTGGKIDEHILEGLKYC